MYSVDLREGMGDEKIAGLKIRPSCMMDTNGIDPARDSVVLGKLSTEYPPESLLLRINVELHV